MSAPTISPSCSTAIGVAEGTSFITENFSLADTDGTSFITESCSSADTDPMLIANAMAAADA